MAVLIFLPHKKIFRKVLFYPLSVCLSVCLFVCPEDLSVTARPNGTNFGMCIHDHRPLILQQDEGQGHKVKKTDFQGGIC